MMLLGGQTTESRNDEYLNPVGLAAAKVIPFAGEAFKLIVCSQERKGRHMEQFCSTVHSYLTSFNMVLMCLGVLCGHPPSNGTNWQCQASHK